ncbi:MAG: hypothetical protein IJV12_00645 [Acidaminococcaceae bacterium]|nr:hypothetical protein [Acidaminococcaceae bacterium]
MTVQQAALRKGHLTPARCFDNAPLPEKIPAASAAGIFICRYKILPCICHDFIL